MKALMQSSKVALLVWLARRGAPQMEQGSGARILIAGETEKGARAYEKVIPGFKRSFGGQREAIQPPLDLVPQEMCEKRLFHVWKGWLYCMEFRKPL
jgi:hypothetical protein